MATEKQLAALKKARAAKVKKTLTKAIKTTKKQVAKSLAKTKKRVVKSLG
jgi:Tat protein secretion system quality control protein TatD with DNase activity